MTICLTLSLIILQLKLSRSQAWETPSPRAQSKNSSNVSIYRVTGWLLESFLDFNHILNIDPGDYVEADEIVAKIETDKVTVDIPAPKAGVIG